MSNTEFAKYDFCCNTKQDFYRMLYQLDYIFVQHENGNHDATNIYIDFTRDIDGFELCNLYADIVCGKRPMTKIQSVYEYMADIKGKSVSQIKADLDAEIEKFLIQKKTGWERWANKAYRGFSNLPKQKVYDWEKLFTHKSEQEFKITEIGKPFREEDYYPDDLRAALEGVATLERRIDECADPKEKNRLIKMLIGYRQDVVDLKMHYGYHVEQKAKPQRQIVVSNYEYLDEIEGTSVCEMDDGESLHDQCLLEQIDLIAQEKCTPKQYRVYYMYFKVGMTQQDIASALQISQPAVVDTIRRVVNIIKARV